MSDRRKNFKSAEDISMEGSINLVADILAHTYADYQLALTTIMENRKKYLKIAPKVRAYDYWQALYQTVKDIRNKRYKTMQEMLMIEELKLLKEPPKPTKKESQLFNIVINALYDKKSCEIFYKSHTFQIYTLQRDIDGEAVMKHCKESVGWKDEYEIV